MSTLEEIASAIMTYPKGVLVADEYAEALFAPGTPGPAALALRSPGLDEHVSGVLVTERAAGQGLQRESAVLVGVRLAAEGHDDAATRARVTEAARCGASFVELRANRRPHLVPRGEAHVEAGRLARGAAFAQAEGVLPVLSVALPDIDGASMALSEAVTANALEALGAQLAAHAVDPRELLIRVNFVSPGPAHPRTLDPAMVAAATVRVLDRVLPEGLAGVLMLSSGRSLETACDQLAAVVGLAWQEAIPWRLTFGFSRPLFAAAATALARSEDAARLALVASCRRAGEAMTNGAAAQQPAR
jgi:fructose-bisphosphate aldolase class I